jgi:DNA-binding transcriptional LysR family regulator
VVHNLEHLAVFESVARHLRFASAAIELRVTPTAISKTIAALEATLGVRLFHRTTRSVALTEAGTRLADAVGPALQSLQHGLEAARATDDEPAGAIRISTSFVAYTTLFEPHLRAFLAAHPKIAPEFSIDSAANDIVARGFDVGVRPGRAVQRDMVALPIGPVQRLIVVGPPGSARPRHPRDLANHPCIRQRVHVGGRLLEWQLRSGRERAKPEVSGPLVFDDMRAALGAARAGNGLAYVFEQFAAPDLEAGTLERVLPK